MQRRKIRIYWHWKYTSVHINQGLKMDQRYKNLQTSFLPKNINWGGSVDCTHNLTIYLIDNIYLYLCVFIYLHLMITYIYILWSIVFYKSSKILRNNMHVKAPMLKQSIKSSSRDNSAVIKRKCVTTAIFPLLLRGGWN